MVVMVMKKIDRYALLFLIPGIGLTFASVYIPLSYLHKQIFWTETEAVIADRFTPTVGSEAEVLYRMSYTDAAGVVHQIEVDSENDFMEGRNTHFTRLLYDPADAVNFELVNPGRYLLLLFLPFGLLLVSLRLAGKGRSW
jgi:hypothetical protein